MIQIQGELKSGQIGLSGAIAGQKTFSWDLQLLQLVTLKPFNLQDLNLVYQKPRG